MLRKRHKITEPFLELRLEDEHLAFYFVRGAAPADGEVIGESEAPTVAVAERAVRGRTRRARKRRNRMKTRGWPVVTKIVNSNGQTAVIYKPFVDALSGSNLSRRDQRKVVEEILRGNGNRPSKSSIQYFLDNTAEYLKTQSSGVGT